MTQILHDYPEYAGLLPPAKLEPPKAVRREPCAACGGCRFIDCGTIGYATQQRPCYTCGGTGWVEREVQR